MDTNLSPSAKRVQQAIQERGFHCNILELISSTRTAQEAADAAGCELRQIVKSLVFTAAQTGEPILALVSGANRVDENLLAKAVGQLVVKATGEFVREHTGFAIGGVPPLGHARHLMTFIDADLMELPLLWAAAGTPHAIFSVTPADLVDMTGGTVIKITGAVQSVKSES